MGVAEAQAELDRQRAQSKLDAARARKDERSKLSLSDLVTGGVPEEEAGQLTQFFEAGGVPGFLERTFPNALPKGTLTTEQPPPPPINPDLQARIALELSAGAAAAVATGGVATLAQGARALPHVGRAVRAGLSLVRPTAIAGAEGAASLAGQAFDPVDRPFERAAFVASLSLAAQGAVSGTVGLVNKLRRGASGAGLEEGGREAVEAGLAAGVPPTPGRVSKNAAIDVAERIAESAPGGGRIRTALDKFGDFSRTTLRNFVDNFTSGASKSELLELVQETIREGDEAFRAVGKAEFGAVDDAIELAASKRGARGQFKRAQDTRVDLSTFVRKTEEAAQEIGNPGTRTILAEVQLAQKNGRIAVKGDDAGLASFADAQDMRSFLLKQSRRSDEVISGSAQAAGKRLSPLVDDAIEVTGKRIGGDAQKLLKLAQTNWRKGSAIFNSDLMKELARKVPKSVFDSMGKDPRLIKFVRDSIGDQRLWDNIGGQMILDAMGRASKISKTSPTSKVSGAQFLEQLRSFDSEGALSVMFSPRQIQQYKELGRNVLFSEVEVGTKVAGGMFIQLQTPSAAALMLAAGVGAVPATPALGGAALILFGPPAIARAFSNNAFIKWITLGNKAKLFSDAWAQAVGQVIAVSLAEGGQLGGGAAPTPAAIPTIREMRAAKTRVAP